MSAIGTGSSSSSNRRKTMSRRSAELIGISPGNLFSTPTTTQGIIDTLNRPRIEQDYSQIADLGELKELTLENVVQCLVQRYTAGIYYTYAGGSMLISLNPCFPFTRKSMTNFSQLDQIPGCGYEIGAGDSVGTKSHPHVLSIAKESLRHLYLTSINQVIIVSGNSGAGKTTATQQILCSLIHMNNEGIPKNLNIDQGEFNTLDRQIYLGTLVLEALGNAATITNPNSSRFGRFVQLNYDSKSGRIIGSKIRTCLLEKHRVSKCNQNERNFHIFYYILAAISKDLLKLPEKFSNLSEFIPPAYFSSLKKSDEAEFISLYRSLQSLQLTAEFQHIFEILIGILIMLNVTFKEEKDSESCSSEDENNRSPRSFAPTNMNTVCMAAELFGLDPFQLKTILISRTIKVTRNLRRRESIFRKPCGSIEECHSRLSSMLSKLYDTVFHFVLQKINTILAAGNSQNRKSEINTISLLDLYGFENLQTNQFEQLCINYANERLHYVQVQTIKLENQGIQMVELMKIESDSESRLTAIHDPLFSVLDEACLLNRGTTDEEIHDTLASYCTRSKWIKCDSRKAKDPPQFKISHYAGEVRYDMNGMISKNMDYIPPELYDIFASSSNEFMKNLICNTDDNVGEFGSSKGVKKKTILKRFKSAVDELIEELSNPSQSLRFVRCIRPNDNLAQGKIQVEVIKDQLYSSGIVDIVRIAGNGFPIRITKKQFEDKFPTIIQRFCDGLFVSTFQVHDTHLLTHSDLKVDQRKIYFTEFGWEFVTKLEGFMYKNNVCRIQRLWRAVLESRKASVDQAIESSTVSEEDEGIAINGPEEELENLTSVENSRRNSVACDSLIDGTGTDDPSSLATAIVEILTKTPKSQNKQMLSKFKLQLNLYEGDGIISKRHIEKCPIRFSARPSPLPFARCAPRQPGLNNIHTLLD